MPEPNVNESQDEFIARCVPIVIEDGAAEDQQQAIAICYSMWENADKQLVTTPALVTPEHVSEPDKLPKDEVNYTADATEGEGQCQNCAHYDAPNCSVVAGRVSAEGHCDRWTGSTKAAELHRYTYNGVTCRASRRRSSPRDNKAWMRDVSYKDSERTVHYADPDLPMRRNNPEARAAFNSRHSCDEKRDPLTPGFWACYDWNHPDEKDGGIMKMKYRQPQERKTLPFIVTKVEADQGVVEHAVAVMGNIDEGDDVIHNGAFTKTIVERMGKIRVLDNHNYDSIMRVIGRPIQMWEVGEAELHPKIKARFPEATGALMARTQFLMDTPEGKGAFIRIKEGAVDEYSIGYDTIIQDFSHVDMGGEVSPKTIRNLRELRLFEYSPVIFAMNPATTTTGVKGASGATNLPIASREREWDASAAVGRVRRATDSTEEPSGRYRRAFFWYDAANADEFGSYKLPFSDVVEGELTAIPRGIFASAAALQGARGGVDIPSGDMSAVRSRINRYYARMREQFDDDSIVPPWEKSADTEPETKIGRAISKRNEQRIRKQAAVISEAAQDLEEMLDTVLGTGTDEPPADAQAGDKQRDTEQAGPVEPPTSELERERMLAELDLLIAETQ